ncbi:MAG: universal stress protein [Armatimonadetes bacterium]|nr:universal stress protein [Armatimonadota bacterium]
MKALIGVDLAGSYEPAIRLFEGLGLDSWEVEVVNVVEPILPDGAFPELQVTNPIIQVLDDLTAAGKQLAQGVADSFAAKGRKVSTDVLMGGAASELLLVSEKHGHDLVVVGSHRKSLIGSLFTGSVARTLTSASKASILVGKHEPASTKGLTAVFAHDLSDYAGRALDRFVSWSPTGIERIVLVTADTTDPSIAALIEHDNPEFAGETVGTARGQIDTLQEAVAARLAQVAPHVERIVSEGNPNEVINQTMASSGAALLVMGAQGHGFLERLLIGSTALHHVVREEHNVLVVRS